MERQLRKLMKDSRLEAFDVLHCYYAHGEDNENFQRRSYWLLEELRLQNYNINAYEISCSKNTTAT